MHLYELFSYKEHMFRRHGLIKQYLSFILNLYKKKFTGTLSNITITRQNHSTFDTLTLNQGRIKNPCS